MLGSWELTLDDGYVILGSTFRPIMMGSVIEGRPNDPSMILPLYCPLVVARP